MKDPIDDSSSHDVIIGQSQAWLKIIKKVRSLPVNYDGTVLILGKNGTGKEIIAELLHKEREERDGPFVPINCAAVPENLFESELFGYKKGAFSGAQVDKIGAFELAKGGTIFLDEIGEISLNLQAKLLRVIQEREVRPVGSSESVKIDVFILSATNIDLSEAKEKGTFRKDLYYRLNRMVISLPDLKERGTDILLLAEYFTDLISKKYEKSFTSFSSEDQKRLLDYAWPGNVRELESVIERAVICCSGGIIKLCGEDWNQRRGNQPKPTNKNQPKNH